MKYLAAAVIGIVAALVIRDVSHEVQVRRFARWLDTATVESFVGGSYEQNR